MTHGGRRILLVEDDEDSRNVCRIILEHGGYEVVEARTGPEALSLARATRPELILMDVSIPIMDGWEVALILKADTATRHIVIVALTAHALSSDRARAEEVGCDGFLAKPVSPSDVLSEVRARLRSVELVIR